MRGKFANSSPPSLRSYDRLHLIKIPVLVANGSNDLLVPTENSITLWRKLVNADAHLHLYPDSGHGFLDEYHEHFARLVNEFLDEPKAWEERL
jgi:pimeloyl-ACP methyl ester carboxylesterase